MEIVDGANRGIGVRVRQAGLFVVS